MKHKYRRRLKLYLLDRIKSQVTRDYKLTEAEQAYLFSPTGGTATYKIQEILKARIVTYQQQQNYKDNQ